MYGRFGDKDNRLTQECDPKEITMEFGLVLLYRKYE
jgi:hypothetical protein